MHIKLGYQKSESRLIVGVGYSEKYQMIPIQKFKIVIKDIVVMRGSRRIKVKLNGIRRTE